jgi:hypothetical protein
LVQNYNIKKNMLLEYGKINRDYQKVVPNIYHINNNIILIRKCKCAIYILLVH